MDTVVYALTPAGVDLGRAVADALGAELCVPERWAVPGLTGFSRLADAVEERWPSVQRHIFVAATGIVVRIIAPLLDRKDRDPAVVVVDQAGRYAVSLLSGHLGGANALAREVADVTGGVPVITTATDVAGAPSLDVLAVERGLRLRNLEAVKAVNGALVAGESVRVFDPVGWLGVEGDSSFVPVDDPACLADGGPAVVVAWHVPEALGLGGSERRVLFLHPPVLALGVGCRRGVSAASLLGFWRESLAAQGLALESAAVFGTLEAKRDEEGMTEAARILNVPVTYFEPEELAAVAVPNPSAVVERNMGVPSVCEASAMRLSGMGLLVEKVKGEGMTLAAALVPRF